MSRVAEILSLSHLRSTKIAEHLGLSARYVRRVLAKNGLSHPIGPPPGKDNPAWVGGRMVTQDGYVLLRNSPPRLVEHRFVVEQHLGRPLLVTEVVDHIDGITIHNDISNLRVFPNNGAHLAATTSGKTRCWSAAGRENIGVRTDLGLTIERVDTYRRRIKRGDVRLHAILRASLELGIAHPCLSGTLHWLTQRGIDPTSRRSLELALAELKRRYELDLVL